MIKEIILFIVGLIFLIFGGNWFVDGAVGFAKKFHMPELLIGATVVSIGTSLPEVMVSVTSAAGGQGSIAYGNAIGSIICNTALISAITIAVRPGKVDKKTLKTPAVFFFIAAGIYIIVSYTTQYFSRWLGIGLLVVFAVYIYINIRQSLKPDAANAAQPEGPSEEETKALPVWKSLLLLVIGAVLIAAGADLLVDNGTLIAQDLGVPETVIAFTFVALGTSLPELVTAITSLVKGHSALSLGNVIGANVFNLVLVSGLAITIAPFELPESSLIAGINASLVVDLPLMLIVMLILTIPALCKGKLYRAQGILLLAIYAGFCVYQFTL